MGSGRGCWRGKCLTFKIRKVIFTTFYFAIFFFTGSEPVSSFVAYQVLITIFKYSNKTYNNYLCDFPGRASVPTSQGNLRLCDFPGDGGMTSISKKYYIFYGFQ